MIFLGGGRKEGERIFFYLILRENNFNYFVIREN